MHTLNLSIFKSINNFPSLNFAVAIWYTFVGIQAIAIYCKKFLANLTNDAHYIKNFPTNTNKITEDLSLDFLHYFLGQK